MQNLWIFQSKFVGEFLSIWFTDILLFQEHSFQTFALEIWKHGPPEHTLAGLSTDPIY